MAPYHNKDPWWDYYSDQPYILSKDEKPRLTKAGVIDTLKTLTTSLAISPLLIAKFLMLSNRTNNASAQDFIGLGIQPDGRYQDELIELIDDLNVKHLLLRVPSWRPDLFDALVEFIKCFPKCTFVINILQCRDMVVNPSLWHDRIHRIFSHFGSHCSTFQIANASNRSKWGCHFINEYLQLHSSAQQIRDQHFPHIKLLGSSVIDFEPLASIRSLIHGHNIKLDGCAAALYVNRRLSPYNKQFHIFDLEKKIHLAYAILQLSNRSTRQAKDKLWITETNWPLLNTKPYTPNSGNPRSTVNEADQAKFLTQYYQIAYLTGMVERVYWWQLINPGYGLIDQRSGSLKKLPSYYALRSLLLTGISH